MSAPAFFQNARGKGRHQLYHQFSNFHAFPNLHPKINAHLSAAYPRASPKRKNIIPVSKSCVIFKWFFGSQDRQSSSAGFEDDGSERFGVKIAFAKFTMRAKKVPGLQEREPTCAIFVSKKCTIPSGLTSGFMTGRFFKNHRRRVVDLSFRQFHESSRKTKLYFPFWYSIGETFLRARPAKSNGSVVTRWAASLSACLFNAPKSKICFA